MKTSVFHRTRGPKPITRFYTSFRRFGVLVAFVAMLAATFYSASSASVSSKALRHLTNSAPHSAATSRIIAGKNGGTNLKDVAAELDRGNTSPLTASWFPQPVPTPSPSPEEIETFASSGSSCTTPKTSFFLGETVCVRVSGAPLGSETQRYVTFTSPDGIIMSTTAVTTDPQEFTFTLPSTATTTSGETTIINRGKWKVNTIDASDASLRTEAFFTASNPAQPATDLAIAVNKVGTSDVAAGGTVAFTLEVTNKGPDAALSVQLTNQVPADTTFASITQNEGPSFTCTNPGAGNTGTITCTIASLARDDTATLTAIYNVGAGLPADSIITNSATIANTVSELRPLNNEGTGTARVGNPSCVITCPADVIKNNDPGAYGAIVTFAAPTTSGNCGTVESTPASGSFFDVGTTTVVASGASGSPCSFNVTVNDTEKPVISCPADITTHESSSGSGSATVHYTTSVTDNDPAGAPASCDHPSGSSFPVGETIVTCTATDAAGNTSDPCSFKVTVESDSSNCSLTCPADITLNADAGQCGAIVTYTNATASTECGTVTYSKPSGDFFPVGTTVVTVTTTAGRSCTFKVKVVDNQDPTVTPPADINVNAVSSSCTATVNPGTATATDNCSGVTVKGVRDDGDALNAPYPVGTTVITWTAKDGAGNIKSADQLVKVKDNVPPVVKLVPDITLATPADSCLVEVPEVLDLQDNSEGKYGTASDNCAGPDRLTIRQSPPAGTLVGLGNHTITVKVYDGDPDDPDAPTPNSTTKTTTLHVIDNTPPVITVNGDNPMTVECHTSFTDPGATATDACTPSFAATASGTVDVNTPGTYTITYNASDPSGNAASPKTRTVIVVDTQPPTITLNGAATMTVECHTSFTDPGATANDACAGSVAVTASGSVNVNIPGSYTITYNASDPAGNAALPVTRTVNVVDTIAPTITLNGQTITLWPPNHQYVTVSVVNLVASASDGCDSSIDRDDVVISKVTSDETENGNGDGNTNNDIIIAANCKSVQLRSERQGSGNGRVYTITFRVKDASGNVKTVTAQVKVPKSQGNNGGAVDDGPNYTVNGTCP